MEFAYFLAAVAWVACGVVSWGLTYAYFSRCYPRIPEPRLAHVASSAFGLMTLIAAIWFLIECNGFKNTFKYGVKW